MSIKQPQIPHGYEDITATWLTDVLRRDGCLSEGQVPAEVVAVQYDRTIPQGWKSDMTRLIVSYDRPQQDAPQTLVVKLSSTTPEMRTRQPTRLNYLREVEFYRQLQSRNDLPTPRCYYADVDVETGYHVLVLEDVAPRPVGPVSSGVAHDGCSAAQARHAVVAVAGFHAQWWEHPELAGIPWVFDAVVPDPIAVLKAHEDWWPKFLAAAAHRLPRSMIELGAALRLHLPDISAAMFMASPRTLLHGDYSAANMFFEDAGLGAFTVYDWQTVTRGRGAWELAWFVGQSLTIEQRRLVEADLRGVYHAALLEGGVREYSFDELVRDYRMALLQRFGSLVSSIAALPFTPLQKRRLVDVLLPRNVAAIVDNDAGALLR